MCKNVAGGCKDSMPPPPALRVQLKVKDGQHRSRIVKMGDTVHIVEPFDKFKLEDISAFPPPHIVEMTRASGGGKRGQQQYEIKVQFQTTDRQTRQAVFAPSQLLANKAAFLIGDEVVVQRSIKPTVVPVNTVGVVVGGDGDFYHVSFMLMDYYPPVTVSQDFVPADALTYSSRKRHPRGASKLEQSSASTVGVVMVLPSKDAGKDTVGVVETKEKEGPGDVDVHAAADTEVGEEPPLLKKAAFHLQPHVFQTFKQWVHDEHGNRIENSTHLQGLLVQFLRQNPQQRTQQTGNPAVVIALREAGASPEDVALLAETFDFSTLSVEKAIKQYLSL